MRETKDIFHLLLVEDDMGDAGLVRIAVRRSQRPIELLHAKDGQQAMSILRGVEPGWQDKIPDLVLLDLNLPGRSGHEILQEIKTDPALQCLPVVVLSTSDADRDVRRSYTLGANSFVTKPMDVEAFTHAIHAILGYWFDVCALSPVQP